jgi:hypothetical protein
MAQRMAAVAAAAPASGRVVVGSRLLEPTRSSLAKAKLGAGPAGAAREEACRVSGMVPGHMDWLRQLRVPAEAPVGACWGSRDL